jgi:hypothetical protein
MVHPMRAAIIRRYNKSAIARKRNEEPPRYLKGARKNLWMKIKQDRGHPQRITCQVKKKKRKKNPIIDVVDSRKMNAN